MSYSNSTEFQTSSEKGEGYISGVTFGPKKVRFAVIDGMAVFEGDIILGTVEEIRAFSRDVETGVVITDRRYRWPSGLVPYEIDPNLQNTTRITGGNPSNSAIPLWESATTIRFIERTSANAMHFPNYVFFEDRGVCSSEVGMQGTGRQSISVGTGCTFGNIAHEIGHAVGLFHEQSRERREDFVEIHLENVIPGEESNFAHHISDGDNVGDYDYCSIMHYPPNAFCITPCPGPTIVALQPITCGTIMGQRDGLSNGDIAAVNHIYGDRLLPRYRDTLFNINNIVDVSAFYDPDTNSVTRIIGSRDGVYRNNHLLPVFFSGGSIVSVSGYYSSGNQANNVTVGISEGKLFDIYWKANQSEVLGPYVLTPFPANSVVGLGGLYNVGNVHPHQVVVGTTDGSIHSLF